MRLRFWQLCLGACLATLPLCGQASAQEADVSQLLNAIDQQNARIERLEQELHDARAPQVSAVGFRNWADEDEEEDDDSELADKIKDLESSLEDLTEEVDEFTGDKTIVHSGSSGSTMKVYGRIHADYWTFPQTSGDISNFEGGDDPEDRIGFRRVRIGVGGKIKDNMLYKIEMEYAGGNDVEFRDVFLGWEEIPFLQTVLLGNQKRPYGLDHLNSSRYNVFLERPFIIESFNQDARRFGLVSYGYTDDLAYNWRYGVYNQRLIQDEGNYIGDAYQLELAGRFANTIWYDEVSDGRGYAHWAVSGSYADPAGNAANNEARFRHRPEARSRNRWIDTGQINGASTYTLLGVESVVNVGAFQFVGEYQSVWLDRNAAIGNDLHFDGGYFYISYFLTGEHMPWDRTDGTLDRIKPFQNFWMVRSCDDDVEAGWGAWQIAARYSYGDLTDGNIFGGVGESFTFGLNWYWNANARMQFNYINGNISDRFATRDSGDYNIIGARFMVDF
ncbi:MAG: porin [Pirellulaceae bacterium]